MKFSFEFDVAGFELHATHLARIALDIQYLALSCSVLVDDQPRNSRIIFDDHEQKYKKLVEATGEDLGAAELTVLRIKMESPLLIEVTAKLKEGVKKAFIKKFNYIKDILFLVDLKRKEMDVGIQVRKEEVIAKRIENADALLELSKKIPDLTLRKEFVKGLSRTLLSFADEHPPLLSVELVEEDKERPKVLPSKSEELVEKDLVPSQPAIPKPAEASQARGAVPAINWQKLLVWLLRIFSITLILLFLLVLLIVIEYFRLHA
jgi:hypothetical protein